MNHDALGAELSALTDEEQVMVVGGDAYIAGLLGYGAGYVVGSLVAGWKWINAASGITGGINVL
jgi:hypothetical protein